MNDPPQVYFRVIHRQLSNIFLSSIDDHPSFILNFMRFFLFVLLLTSPLRIWGLQLSVEAESAILMNAQTGKVLFEKNGYTKIYPASTTKIGTLLFALHQAQGELDRVFVAEQEAVASITPQAKKQSNYRSPAYWLESDGTHMGIKKGEKLPLCDLFNGMMLVSANDAANVIAMGFGGSIPKYVEELNAYLKSIGCQQTHFMNPHGLHHPDHQTTAYDLALMTKKGLEDPLFRKIVSTVRCTCPQSNLEEERTFVQFNLLLRQGMHHYPHAIGVKTGTTQAAGKNLVAAANVGGRELIAVAMGYRGQRSELYTDAIKMFEAGFNEPKMKRLLLPEGEQNISVKVKGAKGKVQTYLAEDLFYEFFPSEEVSVKVMASWQIPPLPFVRGTPIGKLRIVDQEGNIIKETALLAWQDVNPTIWHRLAEYPNLHKILFAVVLSSVLLLLFRRKFAS